MSPDWVILYVECCWILFSPVISSASLLAAEFFLLHSSWIIKKCCDSQYDCESGAAALNCAVTFACFSLSSQCSPCLYLCFLTRFTSQSVMLQSSRPKSHLEGARRGGGWGDLDDECSKKSCLPSTTQRVLFVWICIQVRVLFAGVGKMEGGIFFFPIMHRQQGPNWHRGLGSFSKDKHPVSCLTPSEGNLPETSIHHNTCVRCLLKHNQRPKRPTHWSARGWPATVTNDPTSSIFCAPSDSHGCQAWHANGSLALLRPQWLPWEKVMKTAAGRWKIHAVLPYIWVSPPHPQPPLSLFPSLFMDDAQMTHHSVQHMGLGLFSLWSVGEY